MMCSKSIVSASMTVMPVAADSPARDSNIKRCAGVDSGDASARLKPVER